MITFGVVAALLIVLALVFVVPPLFRRAHPAVVEAGPDLAIYRDQLADLERDLQAGALTADRYEQARQELERRLAEELQADTASVSSPATGKGVALAVVAGVPVLAIALYLVLGAPAALDPVATTPEDSAHSVTAEQIEQMVAKLAQRLESAPDDPAGWSMLGRSYAALGRFKEAADAYKQAVKQLPADPQLLADYADALGMAQGRSLKGEPSRLIARALAADPDHFKSLALAGTAAFEARDYPAAIRHWERLAQKIPPDSEFAQSIAGSLAEARQLAGGAAPVAKVQTPNAAIEPVIRGTVRLSPKLAAQVSPDDTLFVFARAINGPRVPLAVKRFRAAQLPVEFMLDKAAAMSPEMTLAQHAEVTVGARISKSGSPGSKSGDLEGFRQPVKVGGSAAIEIVIDTLVP
jgi:cytochrome c-type biogenesis protein CcmH